MLFSFSIWVIIGGKTKKILRPSFERRRIITPARYHSHSYHSDMLSTDTDRFYDLIPCHFNGRIPSASTLRDRCTFRAAAWRRVRIICCAVSHQPTAFCSQQKILLFLFIAFLKYCHYHKQPKKICQVKN